MKPIFLSVVVPVYNEETNLPSLYERLTSVLKRRAKRMNYFLMMAVWMGHPIF